VYIAKQIVLGTSGVSKQPFCPDPINKKVLIKYRIHWIKWQKKILKRIFKKTKAVEKMPALRAGIKAVSSAKCFKVIGSVQSVEPI
jgi:hypothetical protein